MVDQLGEEDVAGRHAAIRRVVVEIVHQAAGTADRRGLVLGEHEVVEVGEEAREMADGRVRAALGLGHAVMTDNAFAHRRFLLGY